MVFPWSRQGQELRSRMARNSNRWEPSFWDSARRKMSSASRQSEGCMCELTTQSGEATHAFGPGKMDPGPAGTALIAWMKRRVQMTKICWIWIILTIFDSEVPYDHSVPISVGFDGLINDPDIFSSRGCGGGAYTEKYLDRRRISTNLTTKTRLRPVTVRDIIIGMAYKGSKSRGREWSAAPLYTLSPTGESIVRLFHRHCEEQKGVLEHDFDLKRND